MATAILMLQVGQDIKTAHILEWFKRENDLIQEGDIAVAPQQGCAEKGCQVEWDVPLYGRLLVVAGGKERMRHYFDTFGWPEEITEKEDWIREMHGRKTERFKDLIETPRLPLRPGVARLVDEAI